MMRAARVVALAVVLGGCAVPSWMPLLGRKGPLPPAPVAGKPLSPDMPMPGDVRELPAASVAIADNVWEPSDAVSVSHEIAYGALVRSAPRFAPSSRN